MLVSCNSSKTTEPEAIEDRRRVETPSPELVFIDSLMWQRPDSSLLVLMEYKGDSNVFNTHYAQLLTSELLFKNDYAQTNRTELLQAVAYFDSLCGRDGVHTVSSTVAFLDARANHGKPF